MYYVVISPVLNHNTRKLWRYPISFFQMFWSGNILDPLHHFISLSNRIFSFPFSYTPLAFIYCTDSSNPNKTNLSLSDYAISISDLDLDLDIDVCFYICLSPFLCLYFHICP